MASFRSATQAPTPRLPSDVLTQPLMAAALSFAAGIGAYHLGGRGRALGLGLLFFGALPRARRFAAGILLFYFAGCFWAERETALYRSVQELLPARSETAEVTGIVSAFPRLEKDRMILPVRSRAVTVPGRSATVEANLELAIYSSVHRPSEFFQPPPLPGDEVRFLAQLQVPDLFRNPGGTSMERRLRERRIHRVAVLKSPALLDYQPQSGGWRKWMLAAKTHNRLSTYWPEGHPTPAFLNALVWGDRSGLSESFVRRSQSVGVYHLLVVSGMHFALILGVLSWIQRQLRIPRALRVALFAAVTVLLLVRTPAGPSVSRAAIVASGAILLECFYRPKNALNLLGAAALGLLCLQPLLLFNAGFQFSFVSCIVLIRSVPPLQAALVYPQVAGLRGCWSRSIDMRQGDPSRDARRIRFRLEALLERHRRLQPIYFALIPAMAVGALLTQWLVVAFLIQNETFLLATWHSNQGPGAALLANLVMVPLTSLLIIPGVALSLSPVSLPPVAWLAERLVAGCYRSVDFFDGWTLPDHPQAGALWLSLFVLILLAQILFRAALVQKVLTLALLALNLGWFLFPDRPPMPGAYFLDVGQGDCAVLVNAEGGAILIDAGTLRSARDRGDQSLEDTFLARDVISRALWQIGVRRIEAIFVSHLHTDHISAVGRLARNFNAKEVVLAPAAGADALFRPFVQSVPLSTRIAFVRPSASMEIAGFKVEVLYPGKEPGPNGLTRDLHGQSGLTSVNEQSMVLRVRAGRRLFLFTGDMSGSQETVLSGKVGKIEVLKVAHHGSISSSSPRWLAELEPDVAVISAGQRNLFGHPHPVVLERLRQRGTRIHRTDQEGYVMIPF